MTHTPGPLTYDMEFFGKNWIIAVVDFGTSPETGENIEGVITTNHVHASDLVYGNPEDDLRLWSAAPELLEALIMVRDADNDTKLDGGAGIPSLARKKIDDAISKATGQS